MVSEGDELQRGVTVAKSIILWGEREVVGVNATLSNYRLSGA